MAEPCTAKLNQFMRQMRARLETSFHKYGPAADNAKLQREQGKRMLDGVQPRFDRYNTDGNTEWLVDAANFCFLEWCFPSHTEAHFRATETHESPGAPALTVREIEAFNKENGL